MSSAPGAVVEATERAVHNFLAGSGAMGDLIGAKDWATTPLGPTERWSPGLRMMVNFLLANRFPLLLWWGPQYISIYNDAYVPVLGNKHPVALGQPVSECWSEIWHILKPLIDSPFNGGPATWMEDIQLEINRRGFVEETHFTIAYSPVPDETAPNGIGGVLATVHEITDKVIGDRRVQLLRDLGMRAADSRTAEMACTLAAETLASYAADVPFALLYLLDENSGIAKLAATAGVAMGDPFSPLTMSPDEAAHWPLAKAAREGSAVIVEDLAACFDTVPPGPWKDPPDCAVIVPIRSTNVHQVTALLVAGISSRIPFDEQYRGFLELVASQIATAIGNARSYEAERRRAEALAEIDRAKTTFFTNVSHEFRTPLTLILAPLQEMLAGAAIGQITEAQRQELQVVHRNGLRLLRLVNTLLDFSRIEAGRLQASYQPTDLASFTADVASGFRSAAERAGLTFDVDCEPLSQPVFLDRDMWEKVVLNLLSNAFNFTLTGGIKVALDAEPDGAALIVRDTGVGIPEHELPRLFKRFHRIEGQRSRSFEGSGIGLALVHELVKLLGGSISVRSRPQHGTEFTVRLPFGTAHLDPERIDTSAGHVSTATSVEAFVQEALRWLPDASECLETQHAPMALRPSILVVDDNADMRDYICHLLMHSYAPAAVGDGDAALAAIREQRPDLVISDVMLPGLDGFELLRAIRQDAELADMPMIMLSARAGEESRAEGLSAGANDYLVKPFSAAELLACVDGNLKLAEQRRRATAELEASERRFRALVQASSDVVYRMSADWSELRHLVGRDVIADTQVPERGWLESYIPPDDQPLLLSAINEAIRNKSAFELEHRVHRIDGTLGWTHSRAIPLLDERGDIVEWFGMASDVTQRKEAESELRVLNERLEARVTEEVAAREKAQARLAQAQRMEALGQLAGGIAHDFNNVLQAVAGGLSLIQKRADNGDVVRRLARMSTDAAERGAAITGRLLAFSRRGELRATPIAPRPLLENLSEILTATLGADIEVRIESAEDISPLLADKAQLETVLVNLAVNARDAMPAGGALTVSARPERVVDARSSPAGLNPGGYVCIELTDTGAGMNEVTLARASEPFFTTKSAGQGTGLGLAMARGFAEQSGGGFAIRSKLGQGTTVTLWFPTAGAAFDRRAQPDEADTARACWWSTTIRWCVMCWHGSFAPWDIASRRPRMALLLSLDWTTAKWWTCSLPTSRCQG